MANVKSKETPVTRESVHVPRGAERDDPNCFVAVNGVNYLLPKGKVSDVPPEIAEEYYRSERAREKFYETVEAKSNKA